MGRLLSRGLGEEGEILFYQETLFIGDPVRYVVEGSCLHRGLVGEPGDRLILLGTLRGRRRKALEMECLCLWELCEGNLEGRLLYWEL